VTGVVARALIWAFVRVICAEYMVSLPLLATARQLIWGGKRLFVVLMRAALRKTFWPARVSGCCAAKGAQMFVGEVVPAGIGGRGLYRFPGLVMPGLNGGVAQTARTPPAGTGEGEKVMGNCEVAGLSVADKEPRVRMEVSAGGSSRTVPVHHWPRP
jgi:hypothetical protein